MTNAQAARATRLAPSAPDWLLRRVNMALSGGARRELSRRLAAASWASKLQRVSAAVCTTQQPPLCAPLHSGLSSASSCRDIE